MIHPSLLTFTTADIVFNKWCEKSGILVSNSTRVITSPHSVAGRGLFALDNIDEGDPIAFIPSHVIFHPENAASVFHETAGKIKESKDRHTHYTDIASIRNGECKDKDNYKPLLKKFLWIHKIWNKIVQRETKKMAEIFQFSDIDDLWQPELTQYAFTAIEDSHPWSEWISQWQRDDPTYQLFASNKKIDDEDDISETVDDLKVMMPFLSNDFLRAALSLRLGRLEEQRQLLGLKDDCKTSAMYAMLGSRAISLNDSQTGVVPFYDMINHSLSPNLSMVQDDEGIKIFSNSYIQEGEELFVCYLDLDEIVDEIKAMWVLVQWGIPTPRSNIV